MLLITRQFYSMRKDVLHSPYQGRWSADHGLRARPIWTSHWIVWRLRHWSVLLRIPMPRSCENYIGHSWKTRRSHSRSKFQPSMNSRGA